MYVLVLTLYLLEKTFSTPQHERKQFNLSLSSSLSEKLPTALSPERDQLLEIASQLSIPPDAWTSLDPSKRMNTIAQLRKYVLSGMDKNCVHSEELHKVSICDQENLV